METPQKKSYSKNALSKRLFIRAAAFEMSIGIKLYEYGRV
jgi:hypothetical protein